MISEIPFTMRRFWKRKSATENGVKSFGLCINTKFTFSLLGLAKAGLQNSIKLIHFTRFFRVGLKATPCSRTTNIA